jgi:hypothetical protein
MGATMTRYIATITEVDGQRPEHGEIFDTAREAWDFLTEQREESEDRTEPTYSAVVQWLRTLADGAWSSPISSGGTGVVWAPTPGTPYPNPGLLYSVKAISGVMDHDHARNDRTG